MQRFYQATEAVYEQVRLALDSVWGHPQGGTVTCIEPAATAPRDADGLVLLAVDEAFTEYPAVSAMLPKLLANGAVAEIDAATYQAAVQPAE